jgi:cytidylate kinase
MQRRLCGDGDNRLTFVVAIDGPAGAGKSTVARRVARELELTYIDTGAMYRAVAWLSLETGVLSTDGPALSTLAQNLVLDLSPLDAEGRQRVTVNGHDVTEAIRTMVVSNVTSAISALPPVRRVVVEQQQRLAQRAPRGVVLEGRDIGTVVFPDADVKIFLTASPEERARRRTRELLNKGQEVSYEQVLAEQNMRDARDSQRAVAPLVPASDAVILPTDGLDIDAVAARILEICEEREKRIGEREK